MTYQRKFITRERNIQHTSSTSSGAGLLNPIKRATGEIKEFPIQSLKPNHKEKNRCSVFDHSMKAILEY